MKRRTLLGLFFACAVTAILAHGRSGAASIPLTRDGHMEMTVRASPAAGDASRGARILAAARATMATYADVANAERAGFTKFLPNIPLPHEHYTNARNAWNAAFGSFDPAAPTSLIYERTPAGLRIEGVMYTAPNRASARDLDERVPLSLGTWHRHVDFCRATGGTTDDSRFGFSGSIDSKPACDAAGGRFVPRIFGWMVHVWPNETDPAKTWAVDAGGEMEHAAGRATLADQNVLPIPPERIPDASMVPGDAVRGAAIFAGNCASCHGSGGANGPDAPRLRGSGLSAGRVAYMVRHPRAIDATSGMPEFGFADRDVADVSAYVASIAATPAPGHVSP